MAYVKKIGSALLKANFGLALSHLLSPSTYRGDSPLAPQDNLQFGSTMDFNFHTGGQYNKFYRFSNSSRANYDAYSKCGPLQSILTRRASALSNGVPIIKNAKGDVSISKEAEQFRKLIKEPNAFQTWTQFLTQISVTLDIAEYCVILPLEHSAGFSFGDSKSMFVCPPSLCEIVTTENKLDVTNGGILGVRINDKIIDFEAVIVLTGINPSTADMVKPFGRLESNAQTINNLIGALESEGVLIDQRGPSGIISAKSDSKLGGVVPLTKDEIKDIQIQFNRKYGLKKGQSHIVISDASKELQYFKTGFDINELGLSQTVDKATRRLCDAFGYYATLLGLEESKFSNLEQAEKALYLKFIIPHANNIAEQLTSYFLRNGDVLKFDFSHLPELQKDKKEQAESIKTMTEALKMQFDLDLITQNQMLEALEMEGLGLDGDKRKSQISLNNLPLAVVLGVGGVQALTGLLSVQGISDEARQAALEIVFGLKPEDAARMSAGARVEASINVNQ